MTTRVFNVSFDIELDEGALEDCALDEYDIKDAIKLMVEGIVDSGGPRSTPIGEVYGIDVCEEGVDDLEDESNT